MDNLVDAHMVVKRWIDGKKHQGFTPTIQVIFNRMATFVLDFETGDPNVTTVIVEGAITSTTMALKKLLVMCNNLEPISRGGTNGNSWSEGFPVKGTVEEIKEFLAKGMDTVDQTGPDGVEKKANDLAKDQRCIMLRRACW